MNRWSRYLLLNFFRALFNKTSFVTQCNDSYYLSRPRTLDMAIVWEVCFKKCYLPSFKEINKKRVKNVVDLGANIGIFTLWASKIFNPKIIYAVEPEQENFNLLTQCIELNKLKGVTAIKKAIYKRNEKVGFEKKGLNRAMHKIKEGDNNLLVRGVTFKKLISENGIKNIDYLKIDIEGSERYVLTLENAPFIKKRVKYINVEIHKTIKYNESHVISYLESLGFKCRIFKIWWYRKVVQVEALNRKFF